MEDEKPKIKALADCLGRNWFRDGSFFTVSSIMQGVRELHRVSFIFQSLSHVQLLPGSWTVAHPTPLFHPISQSMLKFKSIQLIMLPNYLILCCPLFLLPLVFPFSSVSSLYQVAKVLEFRLQSFQWIFRVDFPLELTGLISLLSKGLSRVFSSTTIQKYQFFGA